MLTEAVLQLHTERGRTRSKISPGLDAAIASIQASRDGKVGMSYVEEVMRRMRQSSQASAPSTAASNPSSRDVDREMDEYLIHVQAAIEMYGDDFVVVADETPANNAKSRPKKVMAPTGGSGGSSTKVKDEDDLKEQASMMLAVTASGKKLPPTVIVTGKTDLSLKNLHLPSSVFGSVTPAGWSTRVSMVKWFDEVLVPHFNGRPGALILDDFSAHWVDEFVDKCEAAEIMLIAIPAGETPECSPLDAGVNGAVVVAQKVAYSGNFAARWNANVVAKRGEKKEPKRSLKRAVDACLAAFKKVTKKQVLSSWRKVLRADEVPASDGLPIGTVVPILVDLEQSAAAAPRPPRRASAAAASWAWLPAQQERMEA
jgi:hypothetical protein